MPVADGFILQVDKQWYRCLELFHILLQILANGQLTYVFRQLLELPDVGLDIVRQRLGV